jgi:hypothetical protein
VSWPMVDRAGGNHRHHRHSRDRPPCHRRGPLCPVHRHHRLAFYVFCADNDYCSNGDRHHATADNAVAVVADAFVVVAANAAVVDQRGAAVDHTGDMAEDTRRDGGREVDRRPDVVADTEHCFGRGEG